jgi:AraC family transcriptional regulator
MTIGPLPRARVKTARSVANHVRFGRCAEEPNVDRLSGTPAVSGSYDSAVIRDRFRLDSAPTVLARTASVAPIGFTRLTNESAGTLRTKDVPREAAYCFHVVLRRFSLDMWVDGKHVFGAPAQAGACFLFDLNQNPVCEYRTSFDTMRFYISRASLDELSFDRGVRRAGRFKPCLGSPDRAMYGLATAVVDQVEHAGGRNTLFLDHIGLAFHAHLTDAYGDADAPASPVSGGLSPWQLRHAPDFLVAHLDGDPTIAELAQECGLSSGYFARAFRQTMGAAPHQWLITKRIERARELLLSGRLDLAEIAVACGFVDQSHFTRAFARHEGCAPGRWRKLNRGSPRK